MLICVCLFASFFFKFQIVNVCDFFCLKQIIYCKRECFLLSIIIIIIVSSLISQIIERLEKLFKCWPLFWILAPRFEQYILVQTSRTVRGPLGHNAGNDLLGRHRICRVAAVRHFAQREHLVHETAERPDVGLARIAAIFDYFGRRPFDGKLRLRMSDIVVVSESLNE